MTKFIITGKHCTGKHEVLALLEDRGISTGHEFSNFESIPKCAYIDPRFEHYSIEDVNNIFEQKSYLYLSGIEETGVPNAHTYYRGLSHYTFDRSDVVVIPSNQLASLNKPILASADDLVFIWLDSNPSIRIARHAAEHRSYSFNAREDIEVPTDPTFVKTLYGLAGGKILYFNDEVPERVATIIQTLIIHPDLISLYTDNFN